MFQRALVVPFDHLNSRRGVLRDASAQTDLVVMVESARMQSGRRWHPERLFFLISSARHFAQELRESGFTVEYVRAASTPEGVRQVRTKYPNLEWLSAQPSSFEQSRQFEELGIGFVENDFFLTPRGLFFSWAESQKSFVMENFYRAQRLRLGILVEKGKPVGDRWNFDEFNRLPPPKNHSWTPTPKQTLDSIDLDVAKQMGHTPSRVWATNRAGAVAALEHFVKHNLQQFGPYEDAVAKDQWAMHHSLLSPYLNNGLLHPEEVVSATLAAFSSGAPIESVEAFVRQVIGWREYINGMYWFLGEDYVNRNGLAATRKLLPLFTNSKQTKMACASHVVADIESRAWTHHIPRLMILSNLALLTGTNPQQFLDWMRENFVDASQWVMVPNVIGMGVHADGGQLMTKPYAAGGAYLNRMTEYCKVCTYDPKKRVGEDACPFTTLYWDFLDRHRDAFSKNHRMFQPMAGLKKLNDLPEVKKRAQQVLAGLEAGII